MRKENLCRKKISQVSMYVALFTLALVGDSQYFLTVSKYIVFNHLLDQTWEAHDISPCYVFAFKSVLPYEVYT
jgi:hypothetical protein